jgi:hypothetical protein
VPTRPRLVAGLHHASLGTGDRAHGDVLPYIPLSSGRTAVYKHKRFRRKRSKALDFTLFELIRIADELGWFPPKVITWGKRTTLAGFAHEIRKLRNFVHPGVWAAERDRTRFNKATFEVVYEIYEVANSWIVHHVESNLAKRLMRKGK